MIFLINDEFVPVVLAGELSDAEVRALGRLCDSHASGSHLLFCSIDVADSLSKSVQLSQSDRGVFKSILGNYSYYVAQVDMVAVHVNIFRESSVERIEADGRVSINLPLSYLNQVSIQMGVNVFFEHTDDEAIYKAVLARIGEDKRLSGVRLGMVPRGGGGSNTYKFFRASLEHGEISVSIVDSDKKTPLKPDVGQTAKNVIRVIGGDIVRHQVFHAVHVIDVHEVENLIPMEVYSSVCGEGAMLRGLGSLYEAGKKDVFLYFDYKKGLRPCDISECQYMRGYWGAPVSCGRCAEKSRPECFFIPGAGDGHQKSVVELVKKMGFPKTSDATLYCVWERIFEFFLNWCIAAPQKTAM